MENNFSAYEEHRKNHEKCNEPLNMFRHQLLSERNQQREMRCRLASFTACRNAARQATAPPRLHRDQRQVSKDPTHQRHVRAIRRTGK